MKKLLPFLGCLVILGFGCIGGGKVTTAGNWWLDFSLPKGWVMYGPAQKNYLASAKTAITRDLNEIVLQSTDNVINVHGSGVEDPATYEDKTIVNDNYVAIRVLRLDDRRIIPKEAEDLKGGLFLDKVSNTYYYVAGESKYQFFVISKGADAAIADKIIRSVTKVQIK